MARTSLQILPRTINFAA